MSEECCGTSPAATADREEPRSTPWWRDRALLLPALSGLLLALGYGLAPAPAAAAAAWALALIAGGSTFIPGAIRGLLRRKIGVGLLMTIAAAGALALGHPGEAAALAFLFSLAEALEERAFSRAQGGLRALLALIPDRSRVLRDGRELAVASAEVRVGDLLRVRPGERVSTDGILRGESATLDISAVTGESLPREVGAGDTVPAGSIAWGTPLLVEATAAGSDNSLTRIVELVQGAQERRGTRARLADRIARPLVPAVLLAALAVFLWGLLSGDPGTWTERALVVLVAASPCALALAVPVTVISVIGGASRMGLVISSGRACETLGAVNRVALDKTGTLTRNRPRVVEVVPAGGVCADRLLSAAAALEAESTHPLAAAVLERAGREAAGGPESPTARGVHEYPGRGLTGIVGEYEVRLGSPRWVPPRGLGAAASRLEDAGCTVIVVEIAGEVAGLLGLRDEPRAEAAEAVAALRARGSGVLMLTGDNARTARALGDALGITDIRAELLPEDKAAAVREAPPGSVTAMIGDGINDAPALALADVGIAMGAGGSAAAIESAEVVFTGSDLRLLIRGLDHARRGRRIMTQNILLSLAIILVLVPLAFLGILGLTLVVLIHELAEVAIIANGLRAARLPHDPTRPERRLPAQNPPRDAA